MKKKISSFSQYSQEKVHFINSFKVPVQLRYLFKEIPTDFCLIDLGTGDGKFLFALGGEGLLNNASKITAVDLAEERIHRISKIMQRSLPHIKHRMEIVKGDVCNLEHVPSSLYDIAICTSVIEHVSDDTKMLCEIRRILKPEGRMYISSIIKKWYGIWLYYDSSGGFKLDPTHRREYKSKEEFRNLLYANGFKFLNIKTTFTKFPIIDLVIRGLIKIKVIKPNPSFYSDHKLMKYLKEKKLDESPNYWLQVN